jgi:hypothetical protein
MIATGVFGFGCGPGTGRSGRAAGALASPPHLRLLSQGTPVARGDSLQLRTETTVARDTLILAVRLRNTAAREIRVELGGCEVTPELLRSTLPSGQPISGWLRSGNEAACTHHLMLLPLAPGDTVTPSDLSVQVAFADIAASIPAGRYFLAAAVQLGPGSSAHFGVPAGAVQLER